MRIKHPLQTLLKSGSLCLTPPPHTHTPHTHTRKPLYSLCTHSLLPALTKRRKTRKFNNAFERQDYLRRRRHCYAASEISCALLSVCSCYTPSLPLCTLFYPFYSLKLAKDSPQKHIKTLLWCHGRQLTSGVQNYRLLGMWHILDQLGGKNARVCVLVCECVCMGGRGGGHQQLGWVGILFVCFKAGYFFNEAMPWQIWDNPFLSVWKVK